MSTPLLIAERAYSEVPELHNHPYYQVIFPSTGAIRLDLGGAEVAVGPGAWGVVQPGVAHRFWAPPAHRFLVADLDDRPVAHALEALERQAARPGLVRLPLDRRGAGLAALLRAELGAGGLAEPLLAEALAGYLGAALALVLAGDPRPPGGGPTAQIAARAHAYIAANALGPIRLAEVATAAGASVAHAQRCYGAVFGHSMLHAIQTLRLERAIELLRSTDLPIHTIGAAVGFESQSYFTRLFAREVGVPPGRYRQALR